MGHHQVWSIFGALFSYVLKQCRLHGGKEHDLWRDDVIKSGYWLCHLHLICLSLLFYKVKMIVSISLDSCKGIHKPIYDKGIGQCWYLVNATYIFDFILLLLVTIFTVP